MKTDAAVARWWSTWSPNPLVSNVENFKNLAKCLFFFWSVGLPESTLFFVGLIYKIDFILGEPFDMDYWILNTNIAHNPKIAVVLKPKRIATQAIQPLTTSMTKWTNEYFNLHLRCHSRPYRHTIRHCICNTAVHLDPVARSSQRLPQWRLPGFLGTERVRQEPERQSVAAAAAAWMPLAAVERLERLIYNKFTSNI